MLQVCCLLSLQYVFEHLLRHLHSMMISTNEMQDDMSMVQYNGLHYVLLSSNDVYEFPQTSSITLKQLFSSLLLLWEGHFPLQLQFYLDLQDFLQLTLFSMSKLWYWEINLDLLQRKSKELGDSCLHPNQGITHENQVVTHNNITKLYM